MSYDEAGAPAQVGRRLVEGFLQKKLAPQSAALTNNVVHWATGVQWGALYGITAGSLGKPNPLLGALLGPAAWGTAYVVLPPAGLYKPMWEYDVNTLAKDLTAHMVFGMATAVAFRALIRS